MKLSQFFSVFLYSTIHKLLSKKEKELIRECNKLNEWICDLSKKILSFKDKKDIEKAIKDIVKLFEYQYRGIINHQINLY